MTKRRRQKRQADNNSISIDTYIGEVNEFCAKYEIVPAAPIAEKAIPHCNITFVSGNEMKNSITGYFEVLKSYDPTSIGGALPDDSFYYGAK